VTHQKDDYPSSAGKRSTYAGHRIATRQVRALSDAALVGAMRDGNEIAWGEFVDRFRPLLERFAGQTGIPPSDWDTCIMDVLGDTALKLAARRLAVPASLGTYLVRAARNRHLELRRAAARRDRYYASASDANVAEHVVVSLCSESTLRASEGSDRPDAVVSSVLARLASILSAELSEDEVLLLSWRSAGVPHRQIAQWLGISYDAAAKRVTRLAHRLRAIAQLRAGSFAPEERPELGRFFRRVGITASNDVARRGGQQ
jgi:DNA-directed RNA polymerase specialized sigma24 family protein